MFSFSFLFFFSFFLSFFSFFFFFFFFTQGVFSTEKAAEMMKTECCEKKCILNFTYTEMEACMQQKCSKHWILQSFKTFRKKEGCTNFVVAGKKVCSDGWMCLYGISQRLFDETAALHDEGFEEIIHKNKVVTRYLCCSDAWQIYFWWLVKCKFWNLIDEENRPFSWKHCSHHRFKLKPSDK